MKPEYDPQTNGSGCRILGFILLALLAALLGFIGIFVIRLANSPIGSGSGGGIAFIAILLAGISLFAGVLILLSGKEHK